MYVHRPTGLGKEHHDQTIRAARFRVDCEYRVRPAFIRHPFAAADQGDFNLSAYRQFAHRAAPARAQKDRKHRPVPWHCGR
jgi:hypothetical protein